MEWNLLYVSSTKYRNRPLISFLGVNIWLNLFFLEQQRFLFCLSLLVLKEKYSFVKLNFFFKLQKHYLPFSSDLELKIIWNCYNNDVVVFFLITFNFIDWLMMWVERTEHTIRYDYKIRHNKNANQKLSRPLTK